MGIATGSLIHLVLVALGVAVILAQHPQMFDAIRWAGCGLSRVDRVQDADDADRRSRARPERRVHSSRAWRDGVLVNVFNPKTIVFMFAFLPPFVRPENGAPLLQLFILGMIFNIGGTLVNCRSRVFAGSIGEKLATKRALARGFAIASAALFLLLAARMAFERR